MDLMLTDKCLFVFFGGWGGGEHYITITTVTCVKSALFICTSKKSLFRLFLTAHSRNPKLFATEDNSFSPLKHL